MSCRNGKRVTEAVLISALALMPIRRTVSRWSYSLPFMQTGSTPALEGIPQSEPDLTDITVQQGPFPIDGQQYTVVLYQKALRESRLKPTETTDGLTVTSLEIVDSKGQVAYRETFSYSFADGRFSQPLIASAALFAGNDGTAIGIEFMQQTGTAPDVAIESWQVFGVANGRLKPFGAVLPLGEGANIAAGGVVTALMAKGGIVVVPLSSTAEELEIRAWTGNFYALVPIRVDWANGLWGEGEQCYALDEGTLRARGCDMRVEVQRENTLSNAGALVQLYASPNSDSLETVPISPESHVDFLDVQAIVHWSAVDQRAQCNFENVWLHTRIDGKVGWVHGQESFEALGLPMADPR
jgi:hypothetical protein